MRLRLLPCVLVLVTAALPANAATPDNGALDENSAPLEYDFPPEPRANVSAVVNDTKEYVCDPDDSVNPCDTFRLTVTLPAGYAAAHPNDIILIEPTTTTTGSDIDSQLERADGTILTTTRDNPPEQPVIRWGVEDGTNVYLVQIVPGSPHEGGTVTVTLAKDSDNDGVLDRDDECEGTPPGTPVGPDGCPDSASCATSGAAANAARIPLSGTLAIDAAVLRDWQRLGDGAPYGAFVHFFRQTSRAGQDAALRAAGLEVVADFRRHASSVFARGPVAAFRALAARPGVMRIEHNRPIEWHDATQSWTMRARVAQEIVSGGPYYDGNNEVLTGKGVTLGVIDTGLFGAHPDFANRILHNYRLVDPLEFGVGPGFVDVGYGDSDNANQGHGTHVTGIAAGGGQASDGGYPDGAVAPFIQGTFTSASPLSQIIHWGGGGTELGIFGITLAYEHLLDNVGTPTFAALRAVNGSYGDGAGAAYNENDTDKQLIRSIVGCNINMVFSAGNSGGDGSTDRTSSFCKDPTPGVICVASYNDQGIGNINAPLSTFSSRGPAGDPTKYPDIAAPGDLSTSTCAQFTPTQQTCSSGDDAAFETEWQPWYGTISGTSMASPNVVSVIGLLLQADPLLTPAQVEHVLQANARKVDTGYEPDPQNPGGTIHFGYGAGLVDVKSALDAMGVARAGPRPQGEAWTIFEADADPALPGAQDVVKLVMQEYTDAAGVHGIEYRLTLRDIAAFGTASELQYRVENNVNGRHFETTVLATPSAATLPPEPGAGNTAPAVSVGRLGNDLVFRVPYSALGYPPVHAPIHNIAAYTADSGGVLDYAPSEAASAGSTAYLRAMYGRAFTVGLAVPLPQDTESVCVLPGKTKVIDEPGDQVQTPPGQDRPYDILSVHIAEPGAGEFAGKVVFTIKTRGFPDGIVPAGTRWAIRFNSPTAPPSGRDDYFVMMTTEEGAAPTFRYGTTGVTTDPSGTAGARTFQIAGTLEAGSQFFEDGRVQLVLARDNALIGPLAAGGVLRNFLPAVRAPATPNNNAIYDQADGFFHTLIDPAACLNPPTVDAGVDFELDEGTLGTLTGTGGNGAVAYAWKQIAGPAVTLTNADQASASFTAPQVTAATPLTFQLTVRSAAGVEATDTVTATVRDVDTGTGGGGGGGETVTERIGNNQAGGGLPLPTLVVLLGLAALRRRSIEA